MSEECRYAGTPECMPTRHHLIRGLVCSPAETLYLKDAVKLPAKFLTVFVQVSTDSMIFTMIGYCVSLTADYYIHVSTHIVHLLTLSRPPYVSRLVVAVTVNPINRVFNRGFVAHIREKLRESSTWCVPFVTHLNTPTTIEVVPSIVSVITPSPHGSPRVVLRPVVARPRIVTIVFANRPGPTGGTPNTPHNLKSTSVADKLVTTVTAYGISFTRLFSNSKSAFAYHKYIIARKEYYGNAL